MTTLDVRLHAVRMEAHAIHSFEFRPLSGQHLPAFTAGSHIDVHLQDGLLRSYSLCNSPAERDRYVIAVNKDPKSRGGSRQMHERLRVGENVVIGAPRNNFELNETAAHTVLIAGGIGVTPLKSMISQLDASGASWELFYCARSRECAAFYDELSKVDRERVHFNFDHEPGGHRLDLKRLLADMRADAHIYCCGPLPMLAAFEEATAKMPRERVHVEYFSAKDAPAVFGGFQVKLARTQRTIAIEPGQTILDALLDAGVNVPSSCMEGVCGSCETRVLDGTPDHRDLVLSPAERAANDRMMVCCSGSKSEVIVLDL